MSSGGWGEGGRSPPPHNCLKTLHIRRYCTDVCVTECCRVGGGLQRYKSVNNHFRNPFANDIIFAYTCKFKLTCTVFIIEIVYFNCYFPSSLFLWLFSTIHFFTGQCPKCVTRALPTLLVSAPHLRTNNVDWSFIFTYTFFLLLFCGSCFWSFSFQRFPKRWWWKLQRTVHFVCWITTTTTTTTSQSITIFATPSWMTLFSYFQMHDITATVVIKLMPPVVPGSGCNMHINAS